MSTVPNSQWFASRVSRCISCFKGTAAVERGALDSVGGWPLLPLGAPVTNLYPDEPVPYGVEFTTLTRHGARQVVEQ
ncbi:hypothetical protein [Amycolatopsis sp. MJM2582]|uniref:hypothetical protein n=1 Tax=Amycolatopsis sp. MJM2582 TaxID=1427749 RepID=UPI001269BEEA|nr:hypothetical protein [Amycolatopsis sp. MJM2582]